MGYIFVKKAPGGPEPPIPRRHTGASSKESPRSGTHTYIFVIMTMTNRDSAPPRPPFRVALSVSVFLGVWSFCASAEFRLPC
eukprot:897637-Prymnesium_polylepis.1